jgi:hypothetical protein
MRILKNTWFSHFAQKEDIDDKTLKSIASQLEKGQFDADLGGGVYKQRIARSGKGKSGGYRVVIFFKKGKLTFFVYGFAKSNMSNISESELKDFRKLAKYMLSMTNEQVDMEIKAGRYREIEEK